MKTVILWFFAIFALSLSGCRSQADHDGHGRGAPDEDDAPSRSS